MGLHNVAFVVARDGAVIGCQAKNQIPPEDESFYVPDGQRRLFEIYGVSFGNTMCHEGWRYPEAVPWSAVRGARWVFDPQLTGSDRTRVTIDDGRHPSSTCRGHRVQCAAVQSGLLSARRSMDAAGEPITRTGEVA